VSAKRGVFGVIASLDVKETGGVRSGLGFLVLRGSRDQQQRLSFDRQPARRKPRVRREPAQRV
jgi:hypothetical protein